LVIAIRSWTQKRFVPRGEAAISDPYAEPECAGLNLLAQIEAALDVVKATFHAVNSA
jgi:hypothetical protein